MKRTTATNNVSGQFVDRDPSTGTPETSKAPEATARRMLGIEQPRA